MIERTPLEVAQEHVRGMLGSGPLEAARIVRQVAQQQVEPNEVRRALLLMIDRSEVVIDEKDQLRLPG